MKCKDLSTHHDSRILPASVTVTERPTGFKPSLQIQLTIMISWISQPPPKTRTLCENPMASCEAPATVHIPGCAPPSLAPTARIFARRNWALPTKEHRVAAVQLLPIFFGRRVVAVSTIYVQRHVASSCQDPANNCTRAKPFIVFERCLVHVPLGRAVLQSQRLLQSLDVHAAPLTTSAAARDHCHVKALRRDQLLLFFTTQGAQPDSFGVAVCCP